MKIRKSVSAFALPLLLIAASLPARAQVSYTTQHNDNQRSGDNLSETILNQSNVNVNTFGMLFKEAVDDEVYATPLYVPGLTINGATHNVVFVATVNNSVYAFDADTGGAALWHTNYGTPTNHTVVGLGGDCGNAYNDFQGNIGIVGTPVIDTSNNEMFFVAHTMNGGTHTQTLYAINILTGATNASTVVTAAGFDATTNNQRPALTLSNGEIYVAWSSYCDVTPYHGMVVAYSEATLQQTGVFNDTSSGSQGGIWQAGQGVNVDSNGNIYVMTGNGTWDGSANFGETFVKLAPSTLTVEDYFTPSDWNTLNGGDTDLGSAGALLIPGTSLMVGGGKSGVFYLLNTNNMGHETGSDSGAIQEFQATAEAAGCTTMHIHGGPTYYNSASLGPLIYVWGENDFLHEFKFNGSTFPSTTPFANSSMRAATCGMPGVMLSISANGNNDSTAILWGNAVLSGDANHGTVPGIIRAFPATNVSTELWDSQQNAGRDSCGNFAKGGYPVVVNGKLYAGSFGTANAGSGQLCVYGILPVIPEGPYGGTPAAIPGTVLAEKYDTGGQGVGYNVTSINGTDNGFRPDGVDLETTTAPGGGNDVGWTAAGQWFRFTVNVATAGTYTVTFEVASPNGVTDGFHLSNSAGTNLTGSVNIPVTGGWQTWTTVTASVTLPAGQQVLTWNQDNAGYNFDSAAFASTATCTTVPSTPTGLGATAVSSSQINLSWTASTAGTGCSITYSVFRSTTSGFTAGTGNQIASGLTTTTFSNTGLAASTTYYYLVEAVDSDGSSAASNQASATTSAATGPCTSICINSGGPAISPFVADEDFSASNTINHANTINTSKVTNPAPAAVYQTGRDTSAVGPGTTFTYTIGGFTANSSHTVRLHFCETYFTTAGSRTFNVSINGTQVLANFDIFATAGGENIANIQQFTENANASGQYVILFTSDINNALIAGIEID
jgi:Carbohydrate binding module (family 6)/Malectin domain/Fibronectin type III domain/PQQ enzyme repeat